MRAVAARNAVKLVKNRFGQPKRKRRRQETEDLQCEQNEIFSEEFRQDLRAGRRFSLKRPKTKKKRRWIVLFGVPVSLYGLFELYIDAREGLNPNQIDDLARTRFSLFHHCSSTGQSTSPKRWAIDPLIKSRSLYPPSSTLTIFPPAYRSLNAQASRVNR